MNNRFIYILLLIFTISQDVYPDKNKEELLNFINKEVNIIDDQKNSLYPFFEKLYQLKTDKENARQRLVTVFHVGDSHLQAGFLNGTVMDLFHRDFGNAGRGLIIPLKLSRTNEPNDYQIDSDALWKASRCVARTIKFPVGIGGLSIKTENKNFDFTIGANNRNNLNYQFNKIKIFHHPDAPNLKLTTPGISCLKEQRCSSFITEYSFNKTVKEVNFSGEVKNESEQPIYYGMSLENGKAGILYHAIGLNGAQFLHYSRINDLGEQINSLSPDLIIFSLGTNEAFRGNFKEEVFMKEIDRVVAAIHQANSQSMILFTTPAECQYGVVVNGVKKFVPNPLIKRIRDTIIKYCKVNNYACWDLFGISGGEGSSENWIKANLLARDRVHFYVSGYRIQGDLLYDAILKEYYQYVRNRHK